MTFAERTIANKRELGEKIAAIEGLSLSPELSEIFRKFDADGKPSSERIRVLLDHFSYINKVK